jgi:predicted MFS family arabinose efflux permease
LVFLPVLAYLEQLWGWRTAALTVAGAALLVVPLVLWRLRDQPADLGVTALGASPDEPATAPVTTGAARRAVTALGSAVRTRPFWLLAGGFFICGATTNGLIATHFIPAAHDHGMVETAAASLLALVGLFDIVGTIASGWLTDRFDSRVLLGAYYALRGLSLLMLPFLFSASVQPTMLVFILFYGLDWVATVPPTVALCREYYGTSGPIVFGWVFGAHQFGAAFAATAAGMVRDQSGSYAIAWYVAGALAIAAAGLSLLLLRDKRRREQQHVASQTAPTPVLST